MSLHMCDFVVPSSFHNETSFVRFVNKRLPCANATTRVIFTLVFFPYPPLLYEPTSILRRPFFTACIYTWFHLDVIPTYI